MPGSHNEGEKTTTQMTESECSAIQCGVQLANVNKAVFRMTTYRVRTSCQFHLLFIATATANIVNAVHRNDGTRPSKKII